MPIGFSMEQKIKVLVVDDEVELLRNLESDLTEMGFEVFTAGHGLEALDVIKNKPIDIVLSDLNMPHMSGVKLLQELRKNRFHNPFVVLSGFGTRDEAVELLRLGAYDFLPKPTSFDHLKEVLIKASRYVGILSAAREEVKASLSLTEDDITDRVEESIYALARMKALRRK